MNYVKSCLIITMLLGGLFADDCASNDDLGTEGGCGDGMYCGACCDVDGVNYFMCSSQQQPTCEDGGGTWNDTSPCPDIEPDGCNESNWQEYYPNMAECDLAGANLAGANLSNADLTGTWCMGALFVGATLDGTIFDGADLTFAFFDENGDFYDDASYDAGAESVDVGDMNGDGSNNVRDVVMLVEDILNP